MFLIEAAARARPLVATAVGDIAEVVETSCLVPVGDVHALAATIEMVLSDKDKNTALGLAARARVEELFSSERAAVSYREVYERAAARRATRTTRRTARTNAESGPSSIG